MCKYCEVKPSCYDWDKNEYGDIICDTKYEGCKISKSDDGNFYIYLSGSYEDFSEPISFCPFCGRKLK
jgi:hypothetical protein